MVTLLKKTAGAGLMALVLAGSFLVACGGSAPPPAPPKTDVPAVSETSADAGAPAPSSIATEPAGGTSAADAGSPAPNAPKPVAATESKDECTPVGVDFEKRARPKLKECYAAGKKKDPNLEGSVKVKMTVDVKGKIKSVKVVDKTLPDSVADCMLKVIKSTPFPEVEKCWDASLTIPITFPTPH